MAKVRCECGRQYALPDEHLGRRVKCAKCGKAFIARAVEAVRIGDLAVDRGLIAREQLDACLEYQMAANDEAGIDDRRLGDILVREKLLTPEQLASLLAPPQRNAAPAAEPAASAKPAAKPKAKRPTRDHPVGEEHREALRRTVEAAEQQRAKKQMEGTRELPVPAPLRRLRLIHLVPVLMLAIAGVVVWQMWPEPEPVQVLSAYLASCGVDAVSPDLSLATRDLGIDADRVGAIALGEPTTYDYASELAAFAAQKRGTSWAHLLYLTKMPEARQRALRMAAPAFPPELVPRKTTELRITVLPATAALDLKPRGMGAFRTTRCRFYLVRVESGTVQIGWKVAAYEPLPEPADGG